MFTELRPTDVLAAGARIAPHVRRTRLIRSAALSELAGGEVLLKLECEQTTGSYKLRGAFNVLLSLPDDARHAGVVASSAGNHGLALSYAAKTLGIRATIFVPRDAAAVKRDGIAAQGATVDATQPHYDAAMAAAMSFARAHGATFIRPDGGATLMAGQGTVALEILAERPGLRALVLPVGGGGLLGGCASLVRGMTPTVRIIGAQSVNTAAMAKSVAAGRVVEIDYPPTLAEGLAGQIDADGLDIGLHALDGIVTVSEDDIGRAILWLEDEHGLRVEGAGAVGVAALRAGALAGLATPAAIVISGGNIDPERIERLRGSRH